VLVRSACCSFGAWLKNPLDVLSTPNHDSPDLVATNDDVEVIVDIQNVDNAVKS